MSGFGRISVENIMPATTPAPPTILMRYLVLAACLAVCLCGCSAGGDVVQVCCYSTSPADYPPNCYKCPSVVYANTLMACVNATEMPRNITFKQATCVEKNCQINYPQPEQEGNSNSLARYADLAQLISQVLSGGGGGGWPAARAKREAGVNVVKRVETLITGLGAVEFADPDYM